jgi:hypothetical protein
VTGSASVGREDPWSDIDLAFGIGESEQVESTVADWTSRMYAQHEAVHHVDVRRDPWLYRVFLLRNSLQVDLAFAPEAHFGPRAPTFRLVSGKAAEAALISPPSTEELIGLAWLYALHVRSAVARGKLWQAEYMLSSSRDHVLAAACRRLGFSPVEGRGMDQLPEQVTDPLKEALVTRLDAHEIVRAFEVLMDRLLVEAYQADASVAAQLEPALLELRDSTRKAVNQSDEYGKG